MCCLRLEFETRYDDCKVKSRSLGVRFSVPSTGPTTSEEFKAYDQLKTSMKEGKYSSAVGWVVGLRQVLISEGKQYVRNKQEEITECLKTFNVFRNTAGWASTLFFLEQVSYSRGNG